MQVIYSSQGIADRGRLLLRMETKMQGDVEIVEGERKGWRLRMSYWRLGCRVAPPTLLPHPLDISITQARRNTIKGAHFLYFVCSIAADYLLPGLVSENCKKLKAVATALS